MILYLVLNSFCSFQIGSNVCSVYSKKLFTACILSEIEIIFLGLYRLNYLSFFQERFCLL